MKFTAKIAFVAAGLFAGSAMAFQDSMVDYPQNVSYEQQLPVIDRSHVNAELVIQSASTEDTHISYPTVFVETTPQGPHLSRQQVNTELAHFVGEHFRIGVSPSYPERG